MNGASSCGDLEQTSTQGSERRRVSLPEAAPREPDVPVGELLDEGGDLAPGGGAVEARPSARWTTATTDCRRESAQRSRSPSAAGSASASRSAQREALAGVRVEDPERVGVPELEQELADRLAHRLDREAVAGPGLLGGQVVPAEGVGTVGVDHLPGVDDVAFRLRHLLALGVEDQAEADAVAEARLVEEQGRLGELRVEPAAGLVLGLADVVGGEALLELRLVLERVVELREGHRAAVVPGVDHRLDAAHRAAAALAARATTSSM